MRTPTWCPRPPQPSRARLHKAFGFSQGAVNGQVAALACERVVAHAQDGDAQDEDQDVLRAQAQEPGPGWGWGQGVSPAPGDLGRSAPDPTPGAQATVGMALGAATGSSEADPTIA